MQRSHWGNPYHSSSTGIPTTAKLTIGHTANLPKSVGPQGTATPSNVSPVGSNPTDEYILLTALRAHTDLHGHSQTSVRAVLDSLDMVNLHTREAWKDYYLEHMVRLNSVLTEARPRDVPPLPHALPKNDAKATHRTITIRSAPRKDDMYKPVQANPVPALTLHHATNGESSSRSRGQPTLPIANNVALVASSLLERHKLEQETGRSGTDASSSKRTRLRRPRVRSPVRKSNPYSRDSEADLEDASTPSRSPTPPSHTVQVDQSRYKFTEDDLIYFIKYTKWKVKEDPMITKAEISQALSEKASHHSRKSWTNTWSKYRHIVDPILARKSESACRKDAICHPSESESSSEGDREDATYVSDTDSELDAMVGEGSPEEDLLNLGEAGDPVGAPELRTMARYLDHQSDWDGASSTVRICWNQFHEQFTQRPPKSWKQIYKRRQLEIDSLARKYRRRNTLNGEAVKNMLDKDATEIRQNGDTGEDGDVGENARASEIESDRGEVSAGENENDGEGSDTDEVEGTRGEHYDSDASSSQANDRERSPERQPGPGSSTDRDIPESRLSRVRGLKRTYRVTVESEEDTGLRISKRLRHE